MCLEIVLSRSNKQRSSSSSSSISTEIEAFTEARKAQAEKAKQATSDKFDDSFKVRIGFGVRRGRKYRGNGAQLGPSPWTIGGNNAHATSVLVDRSEERGFPSVAEVEMRTTTSIDEPEQEGDLLKVNEHGEV